MSRKLPLIILPLLLVIVGVFVGNKLWSAKLAYDSFRGSIFGTHYQVQYHGHPQVGLDVDAIQEQVEKKLQRIDQIASTWRPGSEISRYNRAADKNTFPLSPELKELIMRSEEIKESTGGAFDIHFKGNGIDVSAIAKGYAVDRIADYLRDDLGIEHFLVDIGGEIRARGNNVKAEPWQIGIYIPPSHAQIKGLRVALKNTSMATSGQYFKESHIRNAATDHAADNDLLSCSVIHPSNATADALATALYVMGAEAGLAWANENKIKAIFIKNDGTIVRSAEAMP
ncbi:MAG: FAD:protein FMN transferase [Akkermansiaceae bacterium]